MTRGIGAGLAFAAAEAAQTIALLPLIRDRVGADGAAAWVVFGASSALVGLAATPYFQPLVRSIVTMLPAGGPVRLPSNWPSLHRRLAWRCAALLAILQGLFVLFLPARDGHLHHLGGAALAMLFAAQHLKLQALGSFTAYNGVGWLGEDKLQMARASVFGLFGSVIVLLSGGGLAGLALVQLISQALLALGARRGLRRLAFHAAATATLTSPGKAAALLCLGLAGYLNVGTDAMLAGRFLTAAVMVDYGVLSRVMALAPAAVGLWVHVRYPTWCAEDCGPQTLGRDLRRVVALLAVSLLLATGVFLAWHAHRQSGLQSALIGLAGLNALLACAVMVLGQMLLAKGVHSFIWPAAAVAACAPALAWLAASCDVTGGFMAGYLCSNILLLVLQVMWFRRSRRRMAGPA